MHIGTIVVTFVLAATIAGCGKDDQEKRSDFTDSFRKEGKIPGCNAISTGMGTCLKIFTQTRTAESVKDDAQKHCADAAKLGFEEVELEGKSCDGDSYQCSQKTNLVATTASGCKDWKPR